MSSNKRLSLIQTLMNYPNAKESSPRETSTLVVLINGFNKNIGLPSYTKRNRIYGAFNVAIICYLIAYILQVIALYEAKDNPERLLECFSILAFTGMGILKLISLYYNRNRWRFLLKQISKLESEQLNSFITSDLDYQSDDEETINCSEFINIYTAKFKTISSILNKLYNFTAVIFILSPFLEYLICRLLGKPSIGFVHILPGWHPLDDLNIFGYTGTVLCEFVAAVYCVLVHISFDLTAFGIMIFVCGQFSLLHDYSARIGGKGRVCNISKKRDDRARFMIRHCHRIHLILVNCITELDQLLKHILGFYFLVATLALCFVALQLKSANMSIMQLVSLFQYMCGTLIQLFLFCWYGVAVLNESSIGMGQGPFAAAYWCISPAIRRDLTILGAGMMRTRHLSAGYFNRLDLPSFVQIVRTAYSCYAVLGQKK